MSQDIISVESCNLLAASYNQKCNLTIGKVKDKNDFSNDTKVGVSTTILYIKPLKYNFKEWEDVRIVSYIIDENTAQTNVWGRPLGGRSLDEVLFKELSKTYKPFELPSIHKKVVDTIDELHLELHRKGVYLEKTVRNSGGSLLLF